MVVVLVVALKGVEGDARGLVGSESGFGLRLRGVHLDAQGALGGQQLQQERQARAPLPQLPIKLEGDKLVATGFFVSRPFGYATDEDWVKYTEQVKELLS